MNMHNTYSLPTPLPPSLPTPLPFYFLLSLSLLYPLSLPPSFLPFPTLICILLSLPPSLPPSPSQDNATMLTEASRGGHLPVVNLLLRQSRVLNTSHNSTSRASKDYHHYDRIKLATGRKGHAHNPHHHNQPGAEMSKTQMQKLSGSAHFQQTATQHNSTVQESGKKAQANSADAKAERQEQSRNSSSSKKDGGGGGGGGGGGEGGGGGGGGGGGEGETRDPGSSKRQKAVEKEAQSQQMKRPSQPSTCAAEDSAADQPTDSAHLSRSGPCVSSSHPPPSSSASAGSTAASTGGSHQPPGGDPPVPGGQMSAEDVLVHCMLQMAQAQSAGPAPGHAPSGHVPPPASNGSTAIPPIPSSSSASQNVSNPQNGHPNNSGTPESAHSLFSRGNFASLDHLSAPNPHPAPKFHARAKNTTSATSGTTATQPTPSPPPPQSGPFHGGIPLSNSDITRLIPHLEAIAGSLQNTSSLEGHYLAALTHSHLLPSLTKFDAPETQDDSSQPVPNATVNGNPEDQSMPLNATTWTIDPNSLLASMDVNTLIQTLTNATNAKVQGSELPPELHTQSVYPSDFASHKKQSQKVRSTMTSSSAASLDPSGGGRGEMEALQNRARPLTASFLLEHNFPMDIPPPTDLLPEHVSGGWLGGEGGGGGGGGGRRKRVGGCPVA